MVKPYHDHDQARSASNRTMALPFGKVRSRLVLLLVCVFMVASVVFDFFTTRSSGISAVNDTFLDSLPPVTDLSIRTEPPRSTIGKVSMIYGPPEPVYERGLRLHKIHNERFGYPMFVLREKTLPGYWSKPAYILKVLLSELEKPEHLRLKWLFWVDADVVLMNTLIPLEIFVPDDEEERVNPVYCMVTNDLHGLNNGAFFLRVNEWSVSLMSAVIATKVYKPTQRLRFGDQTALELQLATETFLYQTRHVPQRWFNAYAGNRGTPDPLPTIPLKRASKIAVKEGDLLVHFPAHYSIRARRMSVWLDLAEKHEPPWEVNLNETTYIEEIVEYWKDDVAAEKKSLRQQTRRVNREVEEARKRREEAAQRVLEEQQQEAAEERIEQSEDPMADV